MVLPAKKELYIFSLIIKLLIYKKLTLKTYLIGKKKTTYQLIQVATHQFHSEIRGFPSPSHDGFGFMNYHQLSTDVIHTVLSVVAFLWSGRWNRTLTDLQLCPAL